MSAIDHPHSGTSSWLSSAFLLRTEGRVAVGCLQFWNWRDRSPVR